jgi:hypothetical protein
MAYSADLPASVPPLSGQMPDLWRDIGIQGPEAHFAAPISFRSALSRNPLLHQHFYQDHQSTVGACRPAVNTPGSFS